tara:strand:- start:90 stop:683 length:594 start_codon:yes stop_codon:yes gene_type:complete
MAIKPTQFEGPIPGQSLTTEPKNVPWEQPAQYADPMDALEMYMKRLGDPETMDELIDMLDIGIPISVVTNSMLSGGVMDGLHSVDTKILLKGVLATQLQTIADVVGVDYKMSMADYDDMDAAKEARMKQKLSVKLEIAIAKGEASDPGVTLQQDVLEGLNASEGDDEMDDGMMESPEIEAVEETQEDMPMGIMAKEV